MEAEAAAAKAAQRNDEAEAAEQDAEASEASGDEQRTLPTDAADNPKPQPQRNFTDPDSHILKGSDGWIQGYNAQAAVDRDLQGIVAIKESWPSA